MSVTDTESTENLVPIEKPKIDFVKLAQNTYEKCIGQLGDEVELDRLFNWKGGIIHNKHLEAVEKLLPTPPEREYYMHSLQPGERSVITKIIGVAFRSGYKNLGALREILHTEESEWIKRLQDNNS